MLGDTVATQKLGHFVTEVVAVVFEQIICTRPDKGNDGRKKYMYTILIYKLIVYKLCWYRHIKKGPLTKEKD